MGDLTYAQLIGQVTNRLNRDDIDDPTASPAITIARDFIQDRINYYAKEYFYSAQVINRSDLATTAGTNTYTLPAGWQEIDKVRVLQGTGGVGIWLPMTKKDIGEILDVDVVEPPIRSFPSWYAIYNMQLRLYPTPSFTGWLIELTGDKHPSAPIANGDINFWTTDAQT